MYSPSTCGFLVLIVFGCVLPTILAAPSNVAFGHEGNELAVNDRNDSTDVDENPLTVAMLVARYGCPVAKAAAVACKLLRDGETNDEVLLERSGDEDMDQIDMNKVREIVQKYGCPVMKAFAFACKLVPGK
ncbi:uncharacterized protein LOC130685968 [Daphnia carinata]|uniref:uncharacterized protein LOC130685968 n=1 Tax=Daphnia carinata TaxID=120202 RepID=UPI0025808C50|nr:uncharacterized protein LOC130685968 [Daphnia carinata]